MKLLQSVHRGILPDGWEAVWFHDYSSWAKNPPWSLSEKQQLNEPKLKWKRQREANQRREIAICSETHLSWIVSVSAVEQGDAEAVRVCESLYGVLERKTKKIETKKKHRGAHFWEKHTGQRRQWEASEEQFKNDNQWAADTAVRTSGSEKVKPSAHTAAGNTSKVSAGFYCVGQTLWLSFILLDTCMKSSQWLRIDGYDFLNSNTVNKKP